MRTHKVSPYAFVKAGRRGRRPLRTCEGGSSRTSTPTDLCVAISFPNGYSLAKQILENNSVRRGFRSLLDEILVENSFSLKDFSKWTDNLFKNKLSKIYVDSAQTHDLKFCVRGSPKQHLWALGVRAMLFQKRQIGT